MHAQQNEASIEYMSAFTTFRVVSAFHKHIIWTILQGALFSFGVYWKRPREVVR